MFHDTNSWNLSFRTIVNLLQSTGKIIPANVNTLRLFTDNEVPNWVPTLPKNIESKQITLDFFSCEWIYDTSIKDIFTHDKYILYIHGGAFCLCNSGTHKGLLYRLAKKTNSVIFSVNYRKSPEFKFPIPLTDCLIAYNYLLGKVRDSSKIFVSGDSAGGNLAIYLMEQIITYDLPKPQGLILLSPWVDLTDNKNFKSWKINEKFDYINSKLANYFAHSYIDSKTHSLQDVSPLYINEENLKKFPKVLISFGEYEVLHDQIYEFVLKLIMLDCDVKHVVGKQMIHVYPLFHFTGVEQTKDFFKAVNLFIA